MEWFFATTEDFLRRTSIMVVKNTYASRAGFKLPPCSWSTGKCSVAIVGWNGFQEMDAFRDCQRTEDIASPRIELTRFAPCRKRVCFRRLDRWKLKSGTLAGLDSLARESALLLFLCILLSGCRSRQGVPDPSIEFTRVPPAAEGGPDKLDIIEGRVVGAHPGQRIVLYARSGTWWVQPLVVEPFTTIQPDSKWTNTTHLGTEYAALLVEPGYQPRATINVLPTREPGMLAVASVKGGGPGSSVSKFLAFSGYEWRIRSAPSSRGGAMNDYDPANAWTDGNGWLHLRITKQSGKWACAEVSLTRTLGYGTYSFVVHDISHLEPAAVLGMFTWDYAGEDPNHREMATEITRWGDPASKNAQYVVQPFYIPANVARFDAPSGVLTHSFRWEVGRVSFRTVRGAEGGNGVSAVSEHVFTSGVPTPGVETIRMNLYVYSSGAPLQNGAEVVVEKFEYLP